MDADDIGSKKVNEEEVKKQLEKVSPEEAKKQKQYAEELMKRSDKLLMSDNEVKKYSAIFYAGQCLCMYSTLKVKAHLEKLNLPVETVRGIMQRMYEEAQKGSTVAHLKQLVANYVMPVLAADKKRIYSTVAAKAAEARENGIPLPFPYLNEHIGGGLKAGKILVLQGLEEAVKKALEAVTINLSKQKVEYSRFVMSSPVKEDKRLIGRIWWGNCAVRKAGAKDVFRPFINSKAIIIDDMEACCLGMEEDRGRRLNVIIRRVLRAIPKKKQCVVMGLKQPLGGDSPTTHQESVHLVDVEIKDGQLFVAGQKLGGVKDAEDSVLSGVQPEAEKELEGLHGAAQAGQPEGSGEDSSKDRGPLGASS